MLSIRLGKCRRAGLTAVALATATLLFLPALSSAAPPSLLFQFPSKGAEENSGAPGKFNRPAGIAADRETGHVFVADDLNSRIQEFTSWGVFVQAFGAAGSGPGQLGGPEGVAIDASGALYVFEGANNRVQKFTQGGEFVLMFGGEVDKTTGADVCTAADVEAGDTCGAGVAGAGPGEFSIETIGSNLAVGPTGTVFVGDVGRIEEFNPDGTFKGEAVDGLGSQAVPYLAVDAAGNIYASLAGKENVLKFSPTGEQLEPTFKIELPGSMTIDSTGNLYVVDRFFFTKEPEVLKFAPGGACLICKGEHFASPPPGNLSLPGIASNVVGDGTSSPGDVYVSTYDGASEGGKSYISAFGPIPRFEPPPEVAPTIEDQSAIAVGTDTAKLEATINPHLFQATTYYAEYGTQPCSEGGCTAQPAPPGSSLAGERDAGVRTGPVALTGLAPNTTYHFRFVAISGGFTVKGIGVGEAEGTFTTRMAGTAPMLDHRAYEMVSPPDKESGDVAIPGSAGGLVNKSVKPQLAAPSGEAVTYASFTAFGADPQSAPGASQYVSRRGPGGWLTENITPPYQGSFTRDPLRGFSPDLAFGAVVQREPILVPGAPEGVENLYLRNGQNGTLTLVTTSEPEFAAGTDYCINFNGASADFGTVIFSAPGALTEEAPVAFEGQNLYEWSQATGIRLVSLLPNETPAPPKPFTGFGAGGNTCEVQSNITNNAISADGSRIFWTSGANQLLARLEGIETIQLDAKQGGSGPAGGGKFWAASDDGAKVFFSDVGKLIPGAAPGSLYLYDFGLEEGERLTNLTPGPEAQLQGVLGAAEDGSSAYFVALGVLTGEEANGEGDKAIAGRPNLYRWQQGQGLQFLATLRGGISESDTSDWAGTPKSQTARVTPDGKHVAFLSVEPLTGFDNRDQVSGLRDSEAFVFDAESGELSCVTCDPTGARPSGSASLPTWSTPLDQPRYLSDDGSRLFFTTTDGLAAADRNGRLDVYEFERAGAGDCTVGSVGFSAESGGCVSLVSTGASGTPSYLVDASSDGRDVFISTAQQLLPQDEDERYDVYDARVDGGFAAPATPGEPCEGEACRPNLPPPPATTPGSSSFEGAGNVVPKPPARACRKGTRRVRRNGKVRCVKIARHGRKRRASR